MRADIVSISAPLTAPLGWLEFTQYIEWLMNLLYASDADGSSFMFVASILFPFAL
jgi:hypothetical protein